MNKNKEGGKLRMKILFTHKILGNFLSTLFFKKIKFIFGCIGSSLLHAGFL